MIDSLVMTFVQSWAMHSYVSGWTCKAIEKEILCKTINICYFVPLDTGKQYKKVSVLVHFRYMPYTGRSTTAWPDGVAQWYLCHFIWYMINKAYSQLGGWCMQHLLHQSAENDHRDFWNVYDGWYLLLVLFLVKT